MFEQTIISNDKNHKLVKKPKLVLYYKKGYATGTNDLKYKEPVNVYYKSKNPIDLGFVKEVVFDKSFKKAKVLTELDIDILTQMPSLEHIDVENVKHVSNFDEIFE